MQISIAKSNCEIQAFRNCLQHRSINSKVQFPDEEKNECFFDLDTCLISRGSVPVSWDANINLAPVF